MPESKRMTAEDIQALLGCSEKLGYLLDTGNLWLADQEVESIARRFSDRIESVHLKDVSTDAAEKTLDHAHFTAIGEGNLPLQKALQTLFESGNADKVLTLEMEGGASVLSSVEKSVRFVRETEELLFQEELKRYDKVFSEYAKSYEEGDERIALKTVHTFKVTDLMDRIASEMDLDLRMRKLAHVAGLFHDVGRYEQIRTYKTFRDLDSVDHANLGVEILEKENFLNRLSKKDQKAVLTAVKNHNKYAVQDGLDEETLLLCRMIRDADKADIFRVVCEESFENSYGVSKEELENSEIADGVLESILHHRSVRAQDRKYPLDYLLGCVAFLFDVNFASTAKIIKTQKYYFCKLDTLNFRREDTKRKMQTVFTEIERFLSTCQ